jgi:hypothetical protein
LLQPLSKLDSECQRYPANLPAGCATAKSKVDAFAFSNYTFNTAAGVMEPILRSYCELDAVDTMPLELAVNEVGRQCPAHLDSR